MRKAPAALALAAMTAGLAACSGHSPTPAPASQASPPAQAAATPSASPGEVISGSQDCAFSTSDGDYTVYVAEEDIAACGEASTALATFGKFWSPVTWSTFASDQQDGSMPDADRMCGLQDGSMTMLVYQVASDDEPAGDGVAPDVCTSEEANGWSPVPEGAIGQGAPSSSPAGTEVPGTLSDPSSVDEPTGDGQESQLCISEYGPSDPCLVGDHCEPAP